MGEKKKFSVKKFIAIASAITIAGVSAFFGYKALSNNYEPDKPVDPVVPVDPVDPKPVDPVEPTKTQLSAPEISYNEKTDTLYWDEIPHSEYYIASINGKERAIDGTTMELEITELGDYIFRVKAVGDNENYTDSSWSNTISYTKEDPEIVAYNKIVEDAKEFVYNKHLAANKSQVSYFNIHSITYKDNVLSIHVDYEYSPTVDGGGFPIENPKFYKRNQINRYTLNLEQSEAKTMEELANVMSQVTKENADYLDCTSLENYYNNDYNLTPFLNDDNLGGELRDFLNQGYEVQPINICRIPGGWIPDNVIPLRVFLRLKKGEDTKYLLKEYLVTLDSASGWNAYVNGDVGTRLIEETKSYDLDSEKLSMYERVKEKAERYNEEQAEKTQTEAVSLSSKSLFDSDNINFAPNR